MNTLINKHKNEIDRICQESGITYLALFGSQARNQAKSTSDVDLLVEFKETPGLIEFVRTKQRFEEVLNTKVDLVTKRGLSKYVAPFVNRDLLQIYG